MPDNFSTADGDAYLSRMRNARKGPAVLKAKLANLRSTLPNTLIFAFEGNDDKIVYQHWINKIKPGLKYEPFPCDGKKYVLQLKQMVERDLGGIGEGVYFFIDRDFDDLRGEVSSPKLFMTDAYSVENYLVTESVLDDILKNEFHCHAEPDCRVEVLKLFGKVYKEFLDITKETNYRLFLARRLSLELTTGLPDRVTQLCSISLIDVKAGRQSATDHVQVAREVTHDEILELSPDFDGFEPEKRYRGKFSLLFFYRWLEKLAIERNDKASKIFAAVDNVSKANHQSLNLGILASKSNLPIGLSEFIQGAVPPPAL